MPGRNLVFFTYAAAVGYRRRIPVLVGGMCETDYSGYPDCRTTYSIDKEGNIIIRPAPQMTDKKCEKCSKPMLLRVGKRGPFLACSGFPRCRNLKKAA